MSNDSCGPGPGLYRDKENGWLFGVCAGAAEYAGLPVLLLRIIAAAALLTFSWFTAVVYLAAAIVMKEKPLTWSGHCHESEFWRRRGRDDTWSHS
ncbi:MAG: PspC domain-containing protein [Woeseia sp.]